MLGSLIRFIRSGRTAKVPSFTLEPLESRELFSVVAGFTQTTLTTEINWGTAMAFAPDGRLFVCQQFGRLRVVKNGALLPTPFLSVQVDNAGERGLLGVALDPSFNSN